MNPVQVDEFETKAADVHHRDWLRLAIRISPFIGLLTCVALVAWGLQSGVLETREGLQRFIDSMGFWGPAAFLIAQTASTVFPIVPGGLLVLAAPILFGPVEGIIYNYISVCAGSLLNFAIARQLGLGLLERVTSPAKVEKYLGWTRKPHFTTGFAVAIVLPVAPDDILCYLAGTTKMRWRTYILIILLGKPWTIIAYSLGVSEIIFRFVHW